MTPEVCRCGKRLNHRGACLGVKRKGAKRLSTPVIRDPRRMYQREEFSDVLDELSKLYKAGCVFDPLKHAELTQELARRLRCPPTSAVNYVREPETK